MLYSCIRTCSAVSAVCKSVLSGSFTSSTESAAISSAWGCCVVGEDQEGIKPKINMLHKNGIGGILDYAAEDDMDDDEGVGSRSGPNEKVVARTFDYGSEAICDGHMKTFMKSIEAAGDAPGRGFAAIKVCMLCCIAVWDTWSHVCFAISVVVDFVVELICGC